MDSQSHVIRLCLTGPVNPGLLLNEVQIMGFGPNEYTLIVLTLAFALVMFGRL